jgi:hypothetical protein
MKYLLKILFLGLLATSARAQLNQIVQLDIPKDSKFQQDITVLPLEKDGLLVTLEQEGFFNRDKGSWTFFRYDTALKERWNVTFHIPYQLEPLLSYHNHEYLFWLFAEPETPKITVVRLDLERGEIDEFNGNLLGQTTVNFFKVLGNTAYIGGIYFDKPIVTSFSFFNSTAKVLHGLYDNHLEINGLEVDEKRNEINVIVKERRNGKCGLAIQSYSAEGKSLRTIHVPEQDGNSLSFISGKMLPINEKETILVGNYSTNCNEFSKGLYLTRLEDGNEKGTNIIKFAELKNFFNFMSPKRQERIREKIEQKKRVGKDPNFSYKLLVHNLIKTDTGTILVAEIYYIQPKNNPSTFTPSANTRLNNLINHDDYRFTHAVICEFDNTGKILWDNALVMDNLESTKLVEQIQITPVDNNWLLAYLKKGKVHLQQINKSEQIGEKQVFEIKTDTTAKADEEANVAAWYAQNFVAWGSRKIENKLNNDAPKEVFYIRKLSYAPLHNTKGQ